MPHITATTLEHFGFVPTKYDLQEGTFYTKSLRAEEMPYYNEHVVDNVNIFPNDLIVVEVCPDFTVQLVHPCCAFNELGLSISSDEGIALLEDAGLKYFRKEDHDNS